MILTSLDEYFQPLFRMAESCMAVRFTQLWNMATIQYGVILNYRFARNLLLSLPVKEFGKVRGKNRVASFPAHDV